MRLSLDLTTHEFLTDPDVLEREEIKAGNHLIRKPSSNSERGEPIRIAREHFTGKYFAQIAGQGGPVPTDLKDKAVHVPGHGHWVTLDAIHPDHPHALEFNS